MQPAGDDILAARCVPACADSPSISQHVLPLHDVTHSITASPSLLTLVEDYPMVSELLKKAEILTEHDPAGKAVTFNNFACFSRQQGRLHASLAYLQKALAIEQKLVHVDTPADTHLNLCAVLSQLGRHREALEHSQQALMLLQEELFADGASQRAAQKPDRIAVLAICYHNIGVECEFLKHHQASLQAYTKGVEIASVYLGATHGITATLERSQAAARTAIEKIAAAKKPGGGRSAGGAGGAGRGGGAARHSGAGGGSPRGAPGGGAGRVGFRASSTGGAGAYGAGPGAGPGYGAPVTAYPGPGGSYHSESPVRGADGSGGGGGGGYGPPHGGYGGPPRTPLRSAGAAVMGHGGAGGPPGGQYGGGYGPDGSPGAGGGGGGYDMGHGHGGYGHHPGGGGDGYGIEYVSGPGAGVHGGGGSGGGGGYGGYADGYGGGYAGDGGGYAGDGGGGGGGMPPVSEDGHGHGGHGHGGHGHGGGH